MGQRKGIQQIPAYRRHSSGQARVVIAGRTHYLGKYGLKVSRQRYDQLIAEWLASKRSKTFATPSNEQIVSDPARLHLATGQPSGKDTTVALPADD